MAIGRKHLRRHFSVFHEPRLAELLLVLLVEEAEAAEGVGEVHVHHAPRGEHGFFVGISEGGEECRDAIYALLHTQTVGGAGNRADALGCGGEDVGVVVAF